MSQSHPQFDLTPDDGGHLEAHTIVDRGETIVDDLVAHDAAFSNDHVVIEPRGAARAD